MKESDIRPTNLLDEYLRLCALDVELFFSSSEREKISCPGCGHEHSDLIFQKNSFDFQECRRCRSLFQSPRPLMSEFKRFYEDSPSSNYWAETFFPTVAEARRGLIFAPRAERLAKLFSEKGFRPEIVMEVGAGFGIFLEEWKRLNPSSHICAVEPNKKMAELCRSKGIETLEALAETAGAWHGKADLVVCFEVIEHAYDPLSFIQSLTQLVRPGGFVVISGLGGDGFDIQVLWEKSKSVTPPHHLNFLSKTGFETLLQNAGLKDVQVQTPGKLDVDIVRNTLRDDPTLPIPRFLRALMERGPEAQKDFQEFLSKHCLSSHVWAVGRRPT